MCKKMKRSLLCTLFVAFGMTLTAFGVSLKTENVTVNADVATSSEFTMETGAAIRISEELQGIRFATYITKSEYQKFVQQAGENEVEFGTLCMPESFISEENPLEYENVASETNKDGVVNIVADKWAAGYEPSGSGNKYAYISTLTKMPTEKYLTNLCARSYVKIGDSITYTENTVTRSYAGVALAAYADTSAQKPNDTDKSVIYNAYLKGRTFADLNAKNISYDASTTALTAIENGQVKVTEAGQNRAWKNVFFQWGETLKKGETYRISFDLDIAQTTDCSLYIGLVNDNKRLDDAFSGNVYKKLSTGEISFTYVPEKDLETFSLMLFSNFDSVGGTYQYEYTIDNISVAKMSYVTAGEYALPFTVAPLRTDFAVTDCDGMSENYGAFSVSGNTAQSWCGATFTFAEMKAGSYLFNVKVKNNGTAATGLYIFYNEGAGNVVADTMENVSIAAGATKEYSARIDVTADTTNFSLIMFALSEAHEFVFGDLTVYNAERTSNSSAVRSYTIKYQNATGDNPVSKATVFVPTTTTLTENAVGTVSATTIGGWQGVYIDFGTLPAGDYKLSLQVRNISGTAMKLFSRKFINNVQSGLTDFNSVDDNTTRDLNATITLSETSSLMIRIFSANNGSLSSFKFEIGSLTLGATKIANAGTLGGDFTSFTASNTTVVRSVADPSLYANNFVGTITCGEGSADAWRGMYMRINPSLAGTYTFTFKVTNRTGSEIKMYSKVEGYTAAKVSEHGGLAAGATKMYTVTVTADGTSTSTFIQLNVFSMNASGHTFELGDLKCDYVAS